MKHKELFSLLDDIQEDQEESTSKKHDRVLILDGLNLFFRNFAMMNMVNPDGIHIGGLGGFFRSLGAMIRQTNPTSVYVVFDGAGSTVNRKNLISEYKGTRNLQRITNWEAFDNLEEEHDSKIDQIVRIIQYLKLLPVKTTILDKVEADDIIAVLAEKLVKKHNSTCFIVSSDKDFLQLVTDKIILYRPMEKEYYTPKVVEEKLGLLPKNFILYKTLLGDNSDNIKGIKGLGAKGIFKKFPELKTQELTLDDIFDISTRKFKDHVVYSRIVQDQSRIETNYKVMDLSIPMIEGKGIEHIDNLITEDFPDFNPEMFIQFYNEDKLGGMIRNLDIWLKDIFSQFKGYKD
jgi:5'-3' exonuclease